MLNVKKTLTKLLGLFKDPFVDVSAELTQSTAQGQKGFNIPITIPQGYAFLTIRSVVVSYAECSINAFNWNGTDSRVEISIRNNYAGTLSVKVVVHVICYKLGGGN